VLSAPARPENAVKVQNETVEATRTDCLLDVDLVESSSGSLDRERIERLRTLLKARCPRLTAPTSLRHRIVGSLPHRVRAARA
jgi:hypothetical protein